MAFNRAFAGTIISYIAFAYLHSFNIFTYFIFLLGVVITGTQGRGFNYESFKTKLQPFFDLFVSFI